VGKSQKKIATKMTLLILEKASNMNLKASDRIYVIERGI